MDILDALLNQPPLADFRWDKMGFAIAIIGTVSMIGMLMVLLH